MNKADAQRQINWRIKIIKHASEEGNVARTCRHFGISQKTFYKWIKRYKTDGEAGLCDQAKRPHKCPRQTSPDVVSKILYLRQNYHFGAGRIRNYLQR
jgi:transposase-like protein